MHDAQRMTDAGQKAITITHLEQRSGELKMKTFREKEKLLVLSNLFFCHNVFQKLSAAEVAESNYMWERVKY